jgi:hypothetical protein
MEIDPDINGFTDQQVCEAIERSTCEIMDFWKHNSAGWAPAELTKILTRSMLDRQSSLARTLVMWLNGNSEGELILAWANLGALVEGLLKLVLCVYRDDYVNSEQARDRNGKLIEPDGRMLHDLQEFFKSNVWLDNQKADWDGWIQHIKERRNSIHAFKHREIGTFQEWREDLRKHLMFIRTLDSRLPYP